MTAGTHTATAAGVMARLSEAGLGADAMPGWWRTPRAELGWLSPEDALPLNQRQVVDLADADAALLRRDLTTGGRER
jgi:hypothetical protein